MSLLQPRHDDEPGFDPYRAEHQLQAGRRNWRPWLLFAAFGVVMIGVIYAEPKLWAWVGWGDDEADADEIEITGAYDVAALGNFIYPDPKEPLVVEKEVPVETEIPVPVYTEVEKEVPGAQLPPPDLEEQEYALAQFRGITDYRPGAEGQPQSFMHDGRRPIEAWGCALRPGLTIIHATLDQDVRWDMDGQINATVTSDVLSPEAWARGVRRPLIPAGAKLVGVNASEHLERGMDLAAGPLWTEVNFTDTTGMPRSINLFDAGAANAAGVNGIGGTVDQRWGPIIKAAILFTLLDAVSSVNVTVGAGSSSSDAVNIGSIKVGGDTAATIGAEVVKSMLHWKPIIFTPKGTQVIVKPSVTIRVC